MIVIICAEQASCLEEKTLALLDRSRILLSKPLYYFDSQA